MARGMRVPPSNTDAERSALGCCMAGQRPLAQVMNLLKPEDFYQPAHRTVFEAIISLVSTGKPVDILTVSDHLQSTGDLDTIGGMPALTAMQDAAPVVTHAEYYASVVREKAVLRRLIAAMDEVTALCYESGEDADRLLDLAIKKIMKVGEGSELSGLERLKSILARTVSDINEARMGHRPATGLMTGFPKLDDYLGGLKDGTLTIIAARPAMGKSAFALNIAHHAALHHDKLVAIFSLEMSKEEISYRLLAAQSLIDSRKVTRGDLSEEEWMKLSDSVRQLYGPKIFIDDRASITAMEILSRGRQLAAQFKGIDLILIDYLQLMGSDRRTDSRQQEISEISRTLKVLAKELEVPVIALSQLSRAVESRSDKRPMLSDLRESGAIEQDADAVLFLYRPEYYSDEKRQLEVESAEVIVAKNRSGSTGSIELNWHPKYTLFTEPDYSGREAPPPAYAPLPDAPAPEDQGDVPDAPFDAPFDL